MALKFAVKRATSAEAEFEEMPPAQRKRSDSFKLPEVR
jgi:hypothetical protein